MPYLILFIGLIIAVSAFYRFFVKATPRQIKAMFLSVAATAVGLTAIFLAVSGRLPVALGILTVFWPLGVSYLRNRQQTGTSSELPLNEKEAYEVLGLPQGASPEEVKEAHIRLMKKVHPDQAGSDWLAKKINAAKELLMGQRD